MKLARFGDPGKERAGVLLDDGSRLDASSLGGDYDEAFFASDGLRALERWVARHGASAPRVDASVRLGPPVARPSKIICIGLNFRDHAAESNMALPAEPVIFFKATTALAGPNDPVVIPRGASKLDWEVELAVVIGRRASYVALEEADRYVESFLVRSWAEHLRQHERATHADREVDDRLQTYVTGTPSVRHLVSANSQT